MQGLWLFFRYTYFIIINKPQCDRKRCTTWCISRTQEMIRLKKSPLSMYNFWLSSKACYQIYKSNGMVTPRKVVWLAFFLSKSLYNKKQTDKNKLYTSPLWYKTLRIGYPPPPPFPYDLERYIYQSNIVQNDTIQKVIAGRG